ncbi:hypothetical protein MKW94_004144 [Papaver nudicaule]|uniref:FBD domain-containing protein n=1 Tax=Papaver nudicaule TaxID=74823 RepID=A0AA41V3U4_PAPNU|nr:hypothetical protein [Papaver nudicaule]MCL7034806.1 hypothetical protein [Papaver nudicaule]
MKYVVQTCVLSKRWRYIWTSLPVLRLEMEEHWTTIDDEDRDLAHADEKRFVNFVDKVLRFRDDSDIHAFYLEGLHNEEITINNAYKWIAKVVSQNVQELVIKICIKEDVEFPACLCTCDTLTKLNLELHPYFGRRYKVILPSAMSLPQLRSLTLQSLWVDDEKLANKFLSSFPALESLVMQCCRFYNMNLNLSLPNLRYFELLEVYEDHTSVHLFAPSLTTLDYTGYMSASFTLESLSSLVHANMYLWNRSEDQGEGEIHAQKKKKYSQLVMKFLKGLHNAKVLELDDSSLKALVVGPPDKPDSQLLLFPYIQRLKLAAGLSTVSMRSIFYMLKISPCIEYLQFEVEGNLGAFSDAGFIDYSICSFHLHLKFVMIKSFRGSDIELRFLEILLKHAMVLEKVVLVGCFTVEELQQKEEDMAKILGMLQIYPKASTNVVISYSDSYTTCTPLHIWLDS